MANEHLLLEGAAKEANWNQKQKLDAALEYISNQNAEDAFEDFLRRRVDRDSVNNTSMVSVPEHLNTHNKCPYTNCRSDIVSFGATEFEHGGRLISQEGTCRECDRTWIDWYRLDGHTKDMSGLSEM